MRFIILNENNKVVSIRMGSSPVGNEIESEKGDIGQVKQPDGTFIDDPTPQPEPESEPSELDTIKERLEQAEANNTQLREQIDQLTITLGDALLEGGI